MKKYQVKLSKDQRQHLEQEVKTGQGPARQLTHARILLKADEGEQGPAWSDEQIREAVEVSVPTIERVRQRFVEHGLEDAISRRPQPERHVGGAPSHRAPERGENATTSRAGP